MNAFITLDVVNGVNQYHVDVRAAACDGFSDWYDEGVRFNTNTRCTFSFYRNGVLVAFVAY